MTQKTQPKKLAEVESILREWAQLEEDLARLAGAATYVQIEIRNGIEWQVILCDEMRLRGPFCGKTVFESVRKAAARATSSKRKKKSEADATAEPSPIVQPAS